MKQANSNRILGSTVQELHSDFESNFNVEDLADKKITVVVSKDQEKIKVNTEFVLLFTENLQILLREKTNAITFTEFKVMISIVKFSSYRNVFKVTQQKVAEDTGLDKAAVSKAVKKLKDRKLLIEDEGLEYVNPHLFLKGGIKEAKKDFQQLGLFEVPGLVKPF